MTTLMFIKLMRSFEDGVWLSKVTGERREVGREEEKESHMVQCRGNLALTLSLRY